MTFATYVYPCNTSSLPDVDHLNLLLILRNLTVQPYVVINSIILHLGVPDSTEFDREILPYTVMCTVRALEYVEILCAKPVVVQENKTGRGQGGNNSNGELTRRQVSGWTC